VRRAVLLGLALVLGVTLTACAKSSADTFAGAVLHRPYHAPATELTDTDGQPFSLADSTDKRLTLVFFGYTNCPDVCTVVMSTLASAMTRLDDADRKDVDVVFVTTDPARDTGPVLRRYLDHIDPSFIGVTGPLADIIEVGTGMHIAIDQGEKLPSGGYDVTHGTSGLGIDGHDRVPIVWNQDTSATQYASDIHQLLDS
jgi:protein SCO1/2